MTIGRIFIFNLLACFALLLSCQRDVLNAQPVGAKEMKLDFQATGIHVDRDGKHAIAWGKKTANSTNRGGNIGQGSLSDQVAVIDLEALKVITQKTLSAGVETAIIQKPYSYLTPKSGNVLYRFDALTLGKSKRMFLKHKTRSLTPFTKQQIGVVYGSTYQVIDTTRMKPSQSIVVGDSLKDAVGRPQEVAPGILSFNSKLLNIQDGTVVMFRRPPNLKSLTTKAPLQTGNLRENPGGQKMFGRYISYTTISSASGSPIAQFKVLPCTSPHHHVAFGVRAESTSSGRNWQTTTYFETYSLVDGETLNSQLFDTFDSTNYRGRVPTGMLRAANDKVVHVRQEVLTVIPLDQSKLASAPKPLHFSSTQVPILSTDKAQTILFKADGGNGELKYRLAFETEGIKIDSTSGMVTIDTPSLWKRYVSAPPPVGLHFGKQRKVQYLSEEEYAEMLGKPLPAGKVPFSLPISLAVSDEEAQEDQMTVYAVVHADKTAVDKIEADRLAKLETDRQERLARNNANQEQPMKDRNRTTSAGATERIDELAKRMRRIEATLDMILEKVSK